MRTAIAEVKLPVSKASFIAPTSLPILILTAAALAFTLLNCVKPIHMDDDAYILFAEHIAEQPWTPYDFTIYWGFTNRPANEVLAPPVALYWLAGAMRIFGDQVFLWKLAYLPFHLLLCYSLHSLLRRFAPRSATALTFAVLFSPALLPAANLMLDVPALALGLAGIATWIASEPRRSVGRVIAAGIFAGLAMQTKYSMFTVPFVFLAWGITHRRVRAALIASFIAISVFATWECLMAFTPNGSHFLAAMRRVPDESLRHAQHLAQPVFALTAIVSPGLILIGCAALTRSVRMVAFGAVAIFAGFLLIGLVPTAFAEWPIQITDKPMTYKLDNILYFLLALAGWFVWARAVHLGNRVADGLSKPVRAVFLRPGFWFFGMWLVIELVGAIQLSPFSASRRVFGVVPVIAIILGIAAERLGPPAKVVWSAVACGGVFGLVVALIDIREAWAVEATVTKAARIIARQPGQGRVWFHGAWGFQAYNLASGHLPVVPGESLLHRGDILVLADQPLEQLDFRPHQCPLDVIETIEWRDALPWRTVVCYYSGNVPVRHIEAPRIRATVYRVTADFVMIAHGTRPGLN